MIRVKLKVFYFSFFKVNTHKATHPNSVPYHECCNQGLIPSCLCGEVGFYYWVNNELTSQTKVNKPNLIKIFSFLITFHALTPHICRCVFQWFVLKEEEEEKKNTTFNLNETKGLFLCKDYENFDKEFYILSKCCLSLDLLMSKNNVAFFKLRLWYSIFYQPKVTFHNANFIHSHHSNIKLKKKKFESQSCIAIRNFHKEIFLLEMHVKKNSP